MLKTASKTIGNHTYTVRQLGASEGRKMLVRLVKILGPVLATLLSSAPDKSKAPPKLGWSLGSTKVEDLGKALEVLATRAQEADLEYLCSTLGMATTVGLGGGKEIPLTLEAQELHFAGAYGDMFKWLAFALEHNYSDFFAKPSASAALEELGKVAGPEGEKVS